MDELLAGVSLAALMTLPGIGEKRAVALAEHFGTWDRLLTATHADLTILLGTKTADRLALSWPTEPTTPSLPSGVQVVSRYEAHYPHRLRAIPGAPTMLWWKGTLPPAGPTLAVVGTRTPNQFGAHVATYAAAEAALRGIPTVSGLALGVDSLAHRATLDAGLPTWAVLGQGIDTLPARGDRADLSQRILDNGGGLLCEVPPGTPVAGHLLVQRNRLQSGLSDAVFIAQTGLADGPKPAGTLHTARFALEQGRTLAVAVPPAALCAGADMAGNMALSDPAGMDPAALHATAPDLSDMIRVRVPVADLCIRQPRDFADLWTRILSAH